MFGKAADRYEILVSQEFVCYRFWMSVMTISHREAILHTLALTDD